MNKKENETEGAELKEIVKTKMFEIFVAMNADDEMKKSMVYNLRRLRGCIPATICDMNDAYLWEFFAKNVLIEYFTESAEKMHEVIEQSDDNARLMNWTIRAFNNKFCFTKYLRKFQQFLKSLTVEDIFKINNGCNDGRE